MQKQRWLIGAIFLTILGACSSDREASATRTTQLPDGSAVILPPQAPSGGLASMWELVEIDDIGRPADYVTLGIASTGRLTIDDGCVRFETNADLGKSTETSVGVWEATFVIYWSQGRPDFITCPASAEREEMWKRLEAARASKRHGSRLVLLDAQDQPLLQFNDRPYE